MRKKYYGGHGVHSSLLLGGNNTKRRRGSLEPAACLTGVPVLQSDSLPLVDVPSSSSSSVNDLEYVLGNNGIVEIYHSNDFRRTNNLISVPPLSSFVSDYQRLVEMASSGVMRSFSFQRLQMLSSAFKMHITLNGAAEDEAQSELLGTDFYRTMKVDNHIHLAAAASAKQFVNFVRDKLENEGDTVVMEDGQTLSEVFRVAGLDSDHLTIDAFNVLADYSVYQRFDNFNNKYSPFRMAQMRKIFLKTDNHIDGR